MSASTKNKPATHTKVADYTDFAIRYLENEGYKILERTWVCDAGIVDIIAIDNDTLVFLEVRGRRTITTGFPEQSVTKAKRSRYEIIAAYYLSQTEQLSTRVRFDLLSVILAGNNQAFLKHHKNAFGSDA